MSGWKWWRLWAACALPASPICVLDALTDPNPAIRAAALQIRRCARTGTVRGGSLRVGSRPDLERACGGCDGARDAAARYRAAGADRDARRCRSPRDSGGPRSARQASRAKRDGRPASAPEGRGSCRARRRRHRSRRDQAGRTAIGRWPRRISSASGTPRIRREPRRSPRSRSTERPPRHRCCERRWPTRTGPSAFARPCC